MSSINRYNLIDEPWIPIVGAKKISLWELFSNPTYQEFGGNPIQKISIMKLLLAIAQAACTPEDDEDWRSLGSAGMAEKSLTYLDEWRESFWLYGEKPFLQMPAIKQAEEVNFGTVFPEIATGNTTLLTQSQIEKNIDDADKALLLVSLMGFGLGGKKTDNSVSLSEGYQKGKTGKPGTHIGYLGYLHSFLTGKCILDTLWFNLLTKEQVGRLGYPMGVGIPPWEKMPFGENCSIAESLKKSLIGRLVPVSRFCLLTDKGIHYSEGIVHMGHKEGGIDPMTTIDRSGKEAKAIWVDPSKRPWRWVTTLLNFISQTGSHSFECIQISQGLNRVRENSDVIGIWSGGLKVSSNAGEQYLSGTDDFVESQFLLRCECLHEEWFERLKSEMNELEQLSKDIYKSTRAFFQNQNAEGNEHAKFAVGLFWELCEKKFNDLVESCTEHDFAMRYAVRIEFAEIVRGVYSRICPMGTSRQIEAWAQCRPKMGKYLKGRK